jgi:lysozyme
MANLNEQELSDLIRSLDENFDRFGNRILSDVLTAEELNLRAIRETERIKNIAIQNRKKLIEAIENVSVSFVKTAEQLATADGAFAKIGDASAFAIKTVGNLAAKAASKFGAPELISSAISGFATRGAEVVQQITAETGKAFAAFSKMSSSGLVSNFDDMRMSAAKTGLLYQDYGTILEKHSQTMAIGTGTTLRGVETFKNVLKENSKAAVEAQKMGINFSEFSDMQASYVSNLMRAGIAQSLGDTKIADGARKYVEKLNYLSKVTGKQRSEVQKDLDKLQTDVNWRIMQARLIKDLGVEEGNKRIAELQTMLELTPESQQEGFKQFFAAGGEIIGESSRAYAQTLEIGGMHATKFGKAALNGTINAEQYVDAQNRAYKKYAESFEYVGAAMDENSEYVKNYAQILDAGNRAGKSLVQIYQDMQELRKQQVKQDDAMAKTMNTAYNLAVETQTALTSNGAIMKMNNAMASSLEFLLDGVNGLIGPFDNAKNKSKESKSGGTPSTTPTSTKNKPDSKTQAGPTQLSDNVIKQIIIQNEGIEYKPYQDTKNLWTVGVGHLIGKTLPPEWNRRFTHQEIMSLFDKDFSEHKQAATAIEGFNRLSGNGQAALIDLTFNMGSSFIKSWPELQKQLKNGDIEAAANILESSKWYSQVGVRGPRTVGLLRSATITPAKNGAIVKPTPGGSLYQVGEAGQSEAIIPMPDGKTVPVTFKNSENGKSKLADSLKRMSSRLDIMASLATQQNRIQNKISMSVS